MAERRKQKNLKDFALGTDKGNPVVFLDISINGEAIKRMYIELLNDITPRTSENYRLLCKGRHINGKLVSYKKSVIHRVLPKFMMQGGDITFGNGTGGRSAMGSSFRDENFCLKHGRGSVSMAHQGDSNKSQFFVCFIENASWLDGIHVVFGQVLLDSLDLLDTVEALGTESGRPLQPILVTDCGQICGKGYEPPKPPKKIE